MFYFSWASHGVLSSMSVSRRFLRQFETVLVLVVHSGGEMNRVAHAVCWHHGLCKELACTLGLQNILACNK